ncbi:DUF4350 domain-containing protein [Luteipulveratus halotolerans]|nr:DUF4350 domain-containing protein [Luteipulveratus halotolerans]
MTALDTDRVTAASRPGARRFLRPRVVLAVLAALVVSGLAALLLLGTRESGTPLDPDNPSRSGGQAMARVLADQGVDVQAVRSRDALQDKQIGQGTTVVVTQAQLVTTAMWRDVLRTTSGADRVVLVAPGGAALRALDAPLSRRSGGFSDSSPAGCDAPLARGLTLEGGTERYDPSDGADAQVCFRPGGGFGAGGDQGGYVALLPRTAEHAEVVLLGAPETIRNSDVRDADNAAVGLRTLGQSPTLVWWSVSATDIPAGDADKPVFPRWFAPTVAMLAVTVLALMVLRGRRLGRLVDEPLPVVVRARETTESRGQLYRRSGDAGRASAVLRSATRRRLSRSLGVAPGSSPQTLTDAVAASTGRAPGEIHDLIHGAPAAGDDALVTLAGQLSQLEREVRHR